MRISGDKLSIEELGGPEERPQADGLARERVHAPLLAVDDADRGPAPQARLAERVDGLRSGSARRDDVLDEACCRARLEDALEAVLRAVVLGFLADDDERETRRERRRRGERDGAELRAGEERRLRLVLAHRPGNPVAERSEQVGPGLEAILVEVVAGAATRPEDEVAFEVRVLPQRARELGVVHPRTARSASRPSSSRRSESGEPSGSETIEPSS